MNASDFLKKEPRQERARERLQQILQAAESIALKAGFEEATTSAIAREAGIPVGSIYQYFDNRDALFDYLYKLTFSEVLSAQAEKAADLIATLAWDDFVAAMLAHYWDTVKAHKSYRTLTRWHNATHTMRDTTSTLDSGLGQQIVAMITHYGFSLPKDKEDLILSVVTASLSMTIDLAIDQQDEAKAEMLINEATLLTCRYLAPYAPPQRG